MKKLLKKLQEPFPERGTFRENLISMLGVGAFISLFLYFFRPFGLSYFPNIGWVCLVFGVITFLVGLLIEVVTVYVFKIRKDVPSWTLGKWIVEVMINIFLIGVGNFLFVSYLQNWSDFNLGQLTTMVFFTFAVGLFPLIYSGMRIQMKSQIKNQQQASTLQANLHPPKKNERIVSLSSKNNSQSIQLSIDHLLYLEAMQNYVSIFYIENDNIQKTLFRNTLSEMEEQLQDSPLFRCHRSFMVNTDLIEQVSGNAQGLRITLNQLPDTQIPVSRKYIAPLKAIIA